MSKDIIIYPSGDTTNTNPFVRFSGSSDMNYIMEITDDGYIDLSVEENIVTDGMVFYVDAGNYDSYSGGTTWYDLSGSSDATLINGPIYDNGSILFDGSDDRGTFATPTTSTATSLTYNVWFKGISSASAVNGFGYIIHNNGPSTSTGNSYLTFGVHGGTGKYYAAMNGQYNNMQTSISENSSNFYMMSLTWDGATQKVYINGNLENSKPLVDGFTYQYAWSSTFGLCDQRSGTYRPFDGNLFIINAYNRALSATEVLQNYNAQKHRFGL